MPMIKQSSMMGAKHHYLMRNTIFQKRKKEIKEKAYGNKYHAKIIRYGTK